MSPAHYPLTSQQMTIEQIDKLIATLESLKDHIKILENVVDLQQEKMKIMEKEINNK